MRRILDLEGFTPCDMLKLLLTLLSVIDICQIYGSSTSIAHMTP
jgi:hypothetical protein